MDINTLQKVMSDEVVKEIHDGADAIREVLRMTEEAADQKETLKVLAYVGHVSNALDFWIGRLKVAMLTGAMKDIANAEAEKPEDTHAFEEPDCEHDWLPTTILNQGSEEVRISRCGICEWSPELKRLVEDKEVVG